MKKTITLFALLFFLFSGYLYSQVNTYPYVQTGDDNTGWTVSQTVPLWFLQLAGKNPGNVSNNAALVCNFYAHNAGVNGMVISPVFDFSSLTKPVLNFYMAHKSHITENDSLYVLLSTNGGTTFTNILYARAWISTPSLATSPSMVQEFNPTSANQWRHESIDLSPYAGMTNIRIAFKGVSGFGNNLWIDDFIIANADVYCTNVVALPGSYSCTPKLVVNMNTVGLKPVGVEQSDMLSQSDRFFDQNEATKVFLPSCNSQPVVVSPLQTDNPTGGVLSVTEHTDEIPPSLSTTVIAPNSTATNAGGTITNPNVIYPDYWFTVTYTGNDRLGYANYNVKIDVTFFSDISTLYIIKRADMTSPWVCLNTSLSGSYLEATGLTTFSDFALAGDSSSQPLPVELSSFVSTINGRDVVLNWSTASELNNSGFDIERSIQNGEWQKIGNVSGSGSTSHTHHYTYTDKGLSSGKYNYRLKQIDFNGNHEYFSLSNEVIIGIPSKFELSQNYPNPFNPSTKINFDLPNDSKVSLKIFDMTGKLVASLLNEFRTAGFYTVNYDASVLAAGAYFYRIEVSGTNGDFTAVRKMILIK